MQEDIEDNKGNACMIKVYFVSVQAHIEVTWQ